MDPMGISGAILALLLRTLLLEPFTLGSGAMLPTLEAHDYLITTKYSYGFNQFSLPLGRYLPPFEILKTGPTRGDIVLFALPSDPQKTYIKRVIGLAGDHIQVRNEVVYLNGTALKRERVGDYPLPAEYSNDARATEYRETLPDGKSYEIIELTDNSDGDNTPEFIVPPDHCFVLGDNRDNSADSRFSVGYLPYANIFAKSFVIVDYSGKGFTAHTVK